MKLIIRDDDLSYFTEISQIENAYHNIWNKTKVAFAVIPEIGVVERAVPKDLYEKEKNTNKTYPVSLNKKLVHFLKQKIKEGKIEIYQHGLTHRNYGNKFELERKDLAALFKDLSRGKKILEETFDTFIDTLVAPHDRFSKEAILAIEKVGFRYINRGVGPLPREIQYNKAYLKSFLKVYIKYIKNRNLRYPTFLNFGKHKEIFSYRIQEINKKNIDTILKNSNVNNGVLSVTMHYHTLNPTQKKVIELILDKIKSLH